MVSTDRYALPPASYAYPASLAAQKCLPSRTNACVSPFNLVANSVYGLQPLFTATHTGDLATQILDMTVDDAVIHVKNIRQLVAGEHPAWLCSEGGEQAKLNRCEAE